MDNNKKRRKQMEGVIEKIINSSLKISYFFR